MNKSVGDTLIDRLQRTHFKDKAILKIYSMYIRYPFSALVSRLAFRDGIVKYSANMQCIAKRLMLRKVPGNTLGINIYPAK